MANDTSITEPLLYKIKRLGGDLARALDEYEALTGERWAARVGAASASDLPVEIFGSGELALVFPATEPR